VSPFQFENKPDFHALSGNELVQRSDCPGDLEVLDEFPERHEEAAGISSSDGLVSQETANTL
jgi:hypothetical protein